MTSARLTQLTIASALATFSLLTALGQGVTGIITAKVMDTRGARISGASATISSTKTVTKKKAKTGDDGYFMVTGLRPGPYTIRVEMDGYHPSEKNVVLEAIGRVNATPINLERASNPGGNETGEARITASLEIVLRPLENRLDGASGPNDGGLSELGNFPVIVPRSPGQTGTKGTQSATAPLKPNSDPSDAGRLQVQSLSGERSDLVANNQLKDLALNGRDTIEFLKLIPGIVNDFNGQVSNPGGLDRFFINGTRGNQHELAMDGVSNVDTGTNGSRHVTINPDAVAEIKVLTANYQAEYGKAGGGFIQIVTKSGATELHGGAHFFHRHEGLNANNFFSNASNLARPLYRYKTVGYDIGGPFYLPRIGSGGSAVKKLNNLFFFVNQEFYHQLLPTPPRFLRTPTQKERSGDFSDTRGSGGNLILIKDPTKAGACTNRDQTACFPNNVIPSANFFRDGQAILNLYPSPNITPSEGNDYSNYVSQASTRSPRQETIVRLDYKVSERTDLSGRVVHNRDKQSLPYGLPGNIVNPRNAARIDPDNNPNAQNFNLWKIIFPRPSVNAAITLTHAFSDTLSNESIVGLSRNRARLAPEASQATRMANNLNFPLLFPGANPGDFIPNFIHGIVVPGTNTFGPNTAYNGLPFRSDNNVASLSNNLSKIWKSHLLKVGVFLQQVRREQTARTVNNASISFLNSDNPLAAGHPFANALLGIFDRYEQPERYPTGFYRHRNVEGYIQDLWRVNDRLVLDLGLRLSWFQPEYDDRKQQATFFNPALFDRSRTVRLYEPTRVGNVRRAADPANRLARPTLQNTLPSEFIGAIVPDPQNLANLTNGFGLASQGYPSSGIKNRGLNLGPRFGFAYDLFGDGRTVIRGGFGVFHDRVQGGLITDMLRNPVATGLTYVLRNGRLQDLELQDLDSTKAIIRPPAVHGLAQDGKVPRVYSFSLNFQRDIGFGTVMDAAYVGTLSRHLVQALNLNSVPYGETFKRENQDATKFQGGSLTNTCIGEPGLYQYYKDAGLQFSGRCAKDADFLRPYWGFGDIRYYGFGGSSNYHSLQLSARRRFSSRLAFSFAYTWSKVFSATGDDINEFINPFNSRSYDYRLSAFDRKHVFAASYIHTLPKLSRYLGNNWFAKALFDGWQISGITQFSSGQPFELGQGALGSGLLGIGSSSNIRLAGTPTDGARFYLRDRPQPGPDGLQINPLAFVLPQPGNQGQTPGSGPWPRAYLRGPGVNNHDLSIFRNIPLGAEGVSLQLRFEMFNAFNHTQFSSINKTSFGVGLDADNPNANFTTRQGTFINLLNGQFDFVKAGDNSNRPLGIFFGEYNSARDPRIIQLGVKLYF